MAAPRSALEPVEDDDTAWAAAAAALGNAGWAPKREHLSDETMGGLVLAVRAEFDTLGIWRMPSTTLHQLALGDE